VPTLSRRYATIGGVKVRLAAWLPPDQRYTDRLIPVDPGLQFLPNERTSLVARQASTFWQMNDWKAGEGFDRWSPDREGGGYHQSTNVRPKRIGDGLVIGAQVETTKDSGGSTDFADGQIIGIAQGKLWVVADDTGYEWDGSKWSAGISTGAAGGDTARSLADGQDTWIYTSHAAKTIRRWKSGSTETHYATGTADDFTYDPVLVAFGERLFALDGDDLYEIDLTTANTRTLVRDAGGDSSNFLAQPSQYSRRITVSDRGPMWMQRLNNGQTRIWEYNVAQDVGYIIGELPVGMTVPSSIFYARGFTFVGFVATPILGGAGLGYIYFQRGAQRGVLGPIRLDSSNTAVVICGVVGDELLFIRNGALWAYNFTGGGIFHLAEAATTAGTGANGVVFGPDVFLAGLSSSKVDRYRTDRYTTGTATLASGLYDIAYLDIPKKLAEITVVTEPLPTGTSVSVAYTTDGETYTALSGSHSTVGASERTWQVSTAAGSTVRGRRFGIRLTLATTDATVTPTVRGVLVRASGAAHERQVVMAVDVSSDDTVESQDTKAIIAALRGLVTAQNIVSFSSPLLGDPEDDPVAFDVEVRNLIVPDAEHPTERLAATIELVGTELVVA
jgi:hypothetical protein